MKISKKILTAFMCGLIAIGGSQATSLIKADAAQVTNTTAKQDELWRVGIRFKLRAKRNILYKQWREIQLVCRKNGTLYLDKTAVIPSNMTFDDTFIIGFNNVVNPKGGIPVTKLPFWLNRNIGGDTDAILQHEINDFNSADVRVGDPIYIHGKHWNDTLTLSGVNSNINTIVRRYQSSNDYTKGYKSIDRWRTGFNIKEDGLHECVFIHDDKGVGNEWN